MISLDTLLNLLTFNDYDSVSEFLSTLLAAPQLVMFLEKSPSFKQALLRDLPSIRQAISEQQKIRRSRRVWHRSLRCIPASKHSVFIRSATS